MASQKRLTGSVSAQAERNLELVRQYQETGWIGFRHQLVLENQRLIWKIAQRFLWSGEPIEDLVQEGNIGLIKAADKFPPEFNCQFSTYASYWIRQAISRYVADYRSLIREPVHRQKLLTQVSEAREILGQFLERQPTIDEVSEFLGVSKRVIEQRLFDHWLIQTVSSDESLDDGFRGEQRTFRDFMPEADFEAVAAQAEKSLHAQALRQKIQQALVQLPSKWRAVIVSIYWLDLPQTEIARIMGLTRERIGQLHNQAIEKLREILEESLREIEVVTYPCATDDCRHRISQASWEQFEATDVLQGKRFCVYCVSRSQLEAAHRTLWRWRLSDNGCFIVQNPAGILKSEGFAQSCLRTLDKAGLLEKVAGSLTDWIITSPKS